LRAFHEADFLPRGYRIETGVDYVRAVMSCEADRSWTADDRTLVCRCNGVTRGDVLRSIGRGRASVQQVSADTAAGASCGSCRREVARLLGKHDNDEEAGAICGCTDLDHAALREAIVRGHYGSVDDAMSALSWRKPDGCARCRPAINYYLGCADPSYEDDPQSRIANERNLANLQRDGSYSVVPRLFGGVVTPEQLRAIADVAERFEVPLLKLTGSQRIDLVGISADDLPAVWRELGEVGLVSGHAYARGVRSVKTCVGERFCRYGLADAVEVGVELEQMTWGSFTPHKVKLGVSACARNCAEATVKDIGLIAVEDGWDFYVGGGAGMRVRPGRRVARAKNEREVLEYVGAFLQLYREEGFYGERTASFVERVGLEYVRERLVKDPQGRSILLAAFYRAQKHAQSDPWHEACGSDAKTGLVPLSRLRRAAS
jgi:nitrite reductase (NADH) large subunit